MFAVDEIRIITGQPFDVGVGLTIYQPTMREIAMFGEKESTDSITAFNTLAVVWFGGSNDAGLREYHSYPVCETKPSKSRYSKYR